MEIKSVQVWLCCFLGEITDGEYVNSCQMVSKIAGDYGRSYSPKVIVEGNFFLIQGKEEKINIDIEKEYDRIYNNIIDIENYLLGFLDNRINQEDIVISPSTHLWIYPIWFLESEDGVSRDTVRDLQNDYIYKNTNICQVIPTTNSLFFRFPLTDKKIIMGLLNSHKGFFIGVEDYEFLHDICESISSRIQDFKISNKKIGEISSVESHQHIINKNDFMNIEQFLFQLELSYIAQETKNTMEQTSKKITFIYDDFEKEMTKTKNDTLSHYEYLKEELRNLSHEARVGVESGIYIAIGLTTIAIILQLFSPNRGYNYSLILPSILLIIFSIISSLFNLYMSSKSIWIKRLPFCLYSGSLIWLFVVVIENMFFN